jgi:hypothetical protein
MSSITCSMMAITLSFAEKTKAAGVGLKELKADH